MEDEALKRCHVGLKICEVLLNLGRNLRQLLHRADSVDFYHSKLHEGEQSVKFSERKVERVREVSLYPSEALIDSASVFIHRHDALLEAKVEHIEGVDVKRFILQVHFEWPKSED